MIRMIVVMMRKDNIVIIYRDDNSNGEDAKNE